MPRDPWTDPDPQPGDFDEFLDALDPRDITTQDGRPDAKGRILLSLDSDEASRLQRLAAARGERPSELIAELLREAERTAA